MNDNNNVIYGFSLMHLCERNVKDWFLVQWNGIRCYSNKDSN